MGVTNLHDDVVIETVEIIIEKATLLRASKAFCTGARLQKGLLAVSSPVVCLHGNPVS